MKRTTISLLTLLAFSTSLEAVNMKIDGFEGFYDATLGQKMSDWCVKQTPDGPDSDPQHIYKGLQMEVFTSQEVPTHRLSGYDKIPDAKTQDHLKKGPFSVLAKVQSIDLGDLPAKSYLNIVFTAQHEIWDEYGNLTASDRELVTHGIFPTSLFDGIDEFRLSLLGMSLFSWTVPSETPENICILSQASAEGTIRIGEKEHPLGYWPQSGVIKVGFQDNRPKDEDKTPSMQISSISATVSLTGYTAYIFPGKFDGLINDMKKLNQVRQSGLPLLEVKLANENQDITIPEHMTNMPLNICIVADQKLELQPVTDPETGKIVQTLEPQTGHILMSHLGPKAKLMELSELSLYLTHAQISDEDGYLAPKSDVIIGEVGHDGSERRFTNDTEWWLQRSYFFNHTPASSAPNQKTQSVLFIKGKGLAPAA